MESNFTAPTNGVQHAPPKESFSDPFNVKSFDASPERSTLGSDFVSMVNDSANKAALSAKQVAIEQATCSTEDTTFFSTLSDQTNDGSQSTCSINLSNLIEPNNKTIDSQQTIIVRPVAPLATLEFQTSRPDDTLERSGRSVDPFSSNVEIDPFNANISTFDSISKDDPFNSKEDFFGTSKIEDDSKLDGNAEIDFGEDSKLDAEFEQLPGNVTYLVGEDAEAIEKQFADDSSFEKLDEKECAMARRLSAKLDNILEDSRERNSSESEGEFENELVGPGRVAMHQDEQHQDEKHQDEQHQDEKHHPTSEEVQLSLRADQAEEAAGCGDQSAAQSRAVCEERKPDKMVIWQVQNEQNIKLKDESEMKMNDQLKASASKELSDWYATYEQERKLKMNDNRWVV